MPEYIVEASSIDDFGGFYRAQLPPIVRCKDCKHCMFTEVDRGRFIWWWCDLMSHIVHESGMGFCAWGEKRNDDKEG